MNHSDALVLVLARNAFYKRLHYLALGSLGLSLIAIIFMVWLFIYALKNPTSSLYFVTDDVSRLIQLLPPDQPNMSADEAAAWAIEAVTAVDSVDYVNYRSQMQGAQKYFTNYGWTTFQTALANSDNLLGITGNKMVAIAQVVEKPKVLAQGILGGAYAWKFEMPVLVNYLRPPYDAKSTFTNPLVVTVLVQRQPALQGYKGLGIVQLIQAQAI